MSKSKKNNKKMENSRIEGDKLEADEHFASEETKTAQEYADELRLCMIDNGIPESYAKDVANNSVMPLMVFPHFTVKYVLVKALKHQKLHFGLTVEDSVIVKAASKCEKISRPKD